MISIFGRLRVAARVLLLVGISVASACFLVAAHFYSEAEQAVILHDQAEFVALSETSQELQVGALQMRRREKDFLLRRDMKYVEQYRQAAAEVSKSVNEVRTMSLAGPIAGTVKGLGEGIDHATAQFAKVVELQQTLGLTENEGLQGKLRAAVHGVEKVIGEAGLDPMTVKMLMMRRHEKDFMLRGDAKYIKSVDDRRAEFDVLLSASTLNDSQKADLSKLMDTYQTSFKQYAAGVTDFNAAVAELSAIYGEVEPLFDEVMLFAAEGRSGMEARLKERQALVGHMFLAFAGLMLVLTTGLGVMISLSVSRPLNALTRVMGQLAEGDTSGTVPVQAPKTELGMMAATLRVFRENVLRNRELEAEQVRSAAEAAAAKKMLMQQIANQFDASVGEIVSTVSSASAELSATAGAMSTVSANSNDRALTVSAAAEQASANVQMVASATEEMAASVAEINMQVVKASEVARVASDNVTKSATQMASLAQRADRIGEVVSMISAIAEQTNLLALNATIESARAGVAGKGFAVVASEVKQLANQTGAATQDIVKLVEAIQGETRNAVNAINGIGDVIRDLDAMATAIAAAVSEQGATTREVARNISEAATGAQSVSQNMTAVTEASQETLAASSQLYSSAESLSSQAARLKTEVSRFLETIRAA
ncbi:methyl-accepting chemotaxis protein [Pannonibacter carbonis]|uniref:methyl-accepting chemotaxis protein n=1 Tax=Pannonibacter carbonis TaxID=2067569 RepID=UPI000D108CC8|nr:HAMP domain-containing methyl-accepting chemotaxis protein [Pannonibacter carbonis]